MIEPGLPVSFTGLEIVFLSDSLRNGDTIKTIEDELSELRPLMLVLGSAYREVVSSGGIELTSVEITLTKPMAWLLKSKVRTGDVAIDGKTNVGVPINLKLYELLTRFDSGLEDLILSTEEEPTLTPELRNKLREVGNAPRSIQSANPDPDGNTFG